MPLRDGRQDRKNFGQRSMALEAELFRKHPLKDRRFIHRLRRGWKAFLICSAVAISFPMHIDVAGKAPGNHVIIAWIGFGYSNHPVSLSDDRFVSKPVAVATLTSTPIQLVSVSHVAPANHTLTAIAEIGGFGRHFQKSASPFLSWKWRLYGLGGMDERMPVATNSSRVFGLLPKSC